MPFVKRRDTHHQYVNASISPALSSLREELRHHKQHINPRLQALTKWAQVVMNIDYKLEPIADKSVANILTTLVLIFMPNYCIT